ncbi:MAG: hypothetical protein LBR06_03965 [Bacteroidales bacterium]|nr:hypothetical protein [Bacteroidales bacterium]
MSIEPSPDRPPTVPRPPANCPPTASRPSPTSQNIHNQYPEKSPFLNCM